jgi:fructoselysine-6-P-deglycase FrlB-like protein
VNHVVAEIASQPECWSQAVALAPRVARALPAPGERVAVVGCGTSWFMAGSYAALREAAGHGETDAYPASEYPTGRHYDRIVAISRSGYTTEVIELLRAAPVPTTVLVADATSPAAQIATYAVALPFADERAVVQTRFPTSALALLRAHLGEQLGPVIADAEVALRAPLPLLPGRVEQVSFLGRGWTLGIAHEAALKCREVADFWTEAYPAMDYRHGPISIATARRGVWAFGEIPDGLPEDVEATRAAFVHSRYNPDGRVALDPMADLILAQRFAVAVAREQGLDPDQPRHLSRSVILA